MPSSHRFERRGIVEGFFGPPWSKQHRTAMFAFGARRGMNTYVYAPKDDPYHREQWQRPYPRTDWRALCDLMACARTFDIDFVYAFHPGKGLHFSADDPIDWLLAKASRLYEAGVRTFAVLFDDIPSHLEFAEDIETYDASLAKAEAQWVARILGRQPADWDVEWWFCPSLYSEDPRLAETFGAFEPRFLETIAHCLPADVSCFWTGPRVVSAKITLTHVQKIQQRLRHRLILWDNYPVNDLSMHDEMHLGPLTGRDPRLPKVVYGHLSNPLLQENLSFVPLATCFDFASDPLRYVPERSWQRAVCEQFGETALPHWQALRRFCDALTRKKKGKVNRSVDVPPRVELENASAYVRRHRHEPWFDEFRPWFERLEKHLSTENLGK